MAKSLAGKVVVITGASSGIGLATARAFAKQNARLVLTARNPEPLARAASSCEALGAEVIAAAADMRDESAVQALAALAASRFGRIDVWINNASVMMFGSTLEAPTEAFRQVIETNVFGYLHGIRAVLPFFLSQRSGILINNASGWGLVGAPYVGAYSASKFAVVGLSQTLREELSGMPNIHVCTLALPAIDTPIYRRAANMTGREVGPPPPVYEAEQVAKRMVELAIRPQNFATLGWAGKTITGLARLSPTLAERLMGLMVRAFSIRKEPAPLTHGNLETPRGPYATSGGYDKLGRSIARPMK